jgi:hypothetical protein
MPRAKQNPTSSGAILADIAALETQMASVVRAVEKAAIDLADLRETLAFLKGNRKAAFAWGGLFLSLVGGVIGAIVTALIDRR